MLCAVKDWFCNILSPYFYCVTNAVRAVSAHLNRFCKFLWIVSADTAICKLLYLFTSQYLTLKSKNFMIININLEACCFNYNFSKVNVIMDVKIKNCCEHNYNELSHKNLGHVNHIQLNFVRSNSYRSNTSLRSNSSPSPDKIPI
jgi:hypothetical protein